jgi:hypothetical protein
VPKQSCEPAITSDKFKQPDVRGGFEVNDYLEGLTVSRGHRTRGNREPADVVFAAELREPFRRDTIFRIRHKHLRGTNALSVDYTARDCARESRGREGSGARAQVFDDRGDERVRGITMGAEEQGLAGGPRAVRPRRLRSGAQSRSLNFFRVSRSLRSMEPARRARK